MWSQARNRLDLNRRGEAAEGSSPGNDYRCRIGTQAQGDEISLGCRIYVQAAGRHALGRLHGRITSRC